ETRVKMVRYVLAAHHAYGRRQQRVERFRPTRRRQNFVGKIDVCALREGVYACVRSPGSVNAHWCSGDALKRALQMILDSVAMRLALPAGEWRAVISRDHFQPSGHCNLAIVIGD